MDMTPIYIVARRDKRDARLYVTTYTCPDVYITDMRHSSNIIAVPWVQAHKVTGWIRTANWMDEAERACAIQQATDLLAVYDITPVQD